MQCTNRKKVMNNVQILTHRTKLKKSQKAKQQQLAQRIIANQPDFSKDSYTLEIIKKQKARYRCTEHIF